MRGLSLRGKRPIKFLVIDPGGDGAALDGYGRVLSRHKSLAKAKLEANRHAVERRLRGQKCAVYVWDLVAETVVRW